MLTDGHSGDSEMEIDRQIECHATKPDQSEATIIEILSDDNLLEIFSHCKDVSSSDLSWWQPLVHVCRRWRHVIFALPGHLNLTLLCTHRTRWQLANIWPPIPIALRLNRDESHGSILAVMERQGPHRITDIRFEKLKVLSFSGITWMMKSPFPALTYLSLGGVGYSDLYRDRHDDYVLSDMFLGGSAPSLQTLILSHLQFPALPKLLLSTTQLITLRLNFIPTLMKLSLREIVNCLAALPKLKQLDITHPYMFRDPDPLPTRVILPSLTSFDFNGEFEEFLSQIGAPMLQTLSFSSGGMGRVPQLLRLITRAENLKPPTRVMFIRGSWGFVFKFMPSDGFKFTSYHWNLYDRFEAMALVCLSLSPLLSHVECLDFHGDRSPPAIEYDVDPPYWLKIFRSFIAVQSLRVSKKAWPRMEPVLGALAEERATEIFPELRTLFLEEPFEEDKKSIESLISARRLTVQPYTNPYPDTDC